jgi:hypothetical protein
MWLATVLLASGCLTATADDLYVACHTGISLTPGDIRDIFLGEKQFSKATRLVPVDNVAAQAVFLDKVLKMSAAKYANAWAKKSFRDGVYPPAIKASNAEVLEYIKRTPGGCGYVAAVKLAGVFVLGKY